MSVELEPRTWGIYGFGPIGKNVVNTVRYPGVADFNGLLPDPEYVVRSSGIYEPDGKTPLRSRSIAEPELVIVATPSSGDGTIARNIIQHHLRGGTDVVTAEKGASARHMAAIRGVLRENGAGRFRYSASVGGGTRLVDEALMHLPITSADGIFNGTLNFLSDRVQNHGLGYREAFKLAVDRMLAEPSGDVGGEGTDISLKTQIMVEALAQHDKTIDPSTNVEDFEFELTERDVLDAVGHDLSLRYVVSLVPTEQARDVKTYGARFEKGVGRLAVVGGFQHISRSNRLAPFGGLTGAGNGLIVRGPYGEYVKLGPGAGPEPTTGSILADVRSLGAVA